MTTMNPAFKVCSGNAPTLRGKYKELVEAIVKLEPQQYVSIDSGKVWDDGRSFNEHIHTFRCYVINRFGKGAYSVRSTGDNNTILIMRKEC